MDERYPVGATASSAVAVLRHDGGADGYAGWSTTIGLTSGEAQALIETLRQGLRLVPDSIPEAL
jgi:hypothetical protein